LEWAYLGALGLDPSAPTLYEVLASDPAFFVQMISAIYKPHSAEAAEPLLSAWHGVPGETDDGAIEEEALRSWAEQARELLAVADRVEAVLGGTSGGLGRLQVGEGRVGYRPRADIAWREVVRTRAAVKPPPHPARGGLLLSLSIGR
jgi:hypothetical protein